MNEYFLHYVWRYRAFDTQLAFTEQGERVEIIYPGEYNNSNGPDFLNARIRIGETLWIGHIEIHIKSSDWKKHGHQHDERYQNVILHVVYDNDVDIWLKKPNDLQVMCLEKLVDREAWTRYLRWKDKESAIIVCEVGQKRLPETIWTHWRTRLLIERLESKASYLTQLLEDNAMNWPEAFFVLLSKNFGFRSNADAFEILAKTLDWKVIDRYKGNLLWVEALLFGAAGFLSEESKDAYHKQLRTEWDFLRKKHRLQAMPVSMWNFGGIRPYNFPTIRMAQLAALIHSQSHFLSLFLAEGSLNEIKNRFKVQGSVYWNTHFHFGKRAAIDFTCVPGPNAIDNILLNTLTVALFVFGKYHEIQKMIDLALYIYENCKAEDNHILKEWSSLGVKVKHAGDSQALIQLYNEYCTPKRCLECELGHFLLKKETHDTGNT